MPDSRDAAWKWLRSRAWFLRSRVARRIFLLFLGCTLVPLILFAFLTLGQVSDQLENEAAERLHGECKAYGMSIIERIQSLNNTLALTVAHPQRGASSPLDELPGSLRQQLDERFEWLVVGRAGSPASSAAHGEQELPALTADDLDHLARKGALITFGSHADRPPGVILVVAMGAEAPDEFIFGEIRSSYLWASERLLDSGAELVALTDSGESLYSTVQEEVFEQSVATSMERESANGQFEWSAGGEPHVASYRTLFTRPQIGRNLVIARSQLRAEVLAPMQAFQQLFLRLASVSLLGIMLASLVQIRRSLIPIEILKATTARIRSRDFSARAEIQSRDEFEELGGSFNEMASEIGRHISTLGALHQIGVALTAEENSERLLGIVGTAALDVTRADAVLVHLVDAEGALRVQRMDLRSATDASSAPAEGCLAKIAMSPEGLLSTIALQSSLTGQTLDHVAGVPTSAENDRAYGAIEEACGISVQSAICAPLRNHEGETIGVLEAISMDVAHQLLREDRRAMESLASQAAVALTKNRLVDDFRVLFESLSELLATAIDEKSKYTGEHCRRVPLLTMMLAEEVCAADSGCFEQTQLTEQELYELKIAALLHDCGKVVTPVHVVDKATKLETISDRIELVATRFEIVRRDLENTRLRQALDEAGVSEVEQTRLAEDVAIAEAALEDDLAFIRRCNRGTEWMADDQVDRIRSIASERRWEAADGSDRAFLSEDEVKNLCIRKGTLTEEEREVINYHVVATIKMLETLPYPSYLKNVPQIAGSHHERMDGKGYPLGLKRSELSLQGRILGLADVVEALTAKDRPYKPGKTLSETVTILGKMTEEGHIDPDLFQLFIDSGLYRRYGDGFLDEDQIDDIDLASIPGYDPGPVTRRVA